MMNAAVRLAFPNWEKILFVEMTTCHLEYKYLARLAEEGVLQLGTTFLLCLIYIIR